MTDDEHAAALCSIALTALRYVPDDKRTYKVQTAASLLVNEIARLRGQNPEDIQNEFERRATS